MTPQDLGPKIEAGLLQVVEFDYLNWRNERHRYVIDVESFQFGPFAAGGLDNSDHAKRRWVMHGHVVTRDGDKREELGDNRRRTFLLDKIENLEIVA